MSSQTTKHTSRLRCSYAVALAALLVSCLPYTAFATDLEPATDKNPRVVAGGMASVTREFASGAYSELIAPITITREPGNGEAVYWATQWYFTNRNPDGSGNYGGYMGLQQAGQQKRFNYSIWNTSTWDKNSPANCGTFGHEGSGVQCWIPFEWKQGVRYELKLKSAGIDANGREGWQASVVDTSTNVTTPVATIRVENFGKLWTFSQWVEDFKQGDEQHDSCADVPAHIATWHAPNFEGKTPIMSAPTTYGNCKSVAKSVCTPEHECTFTINTAPPARSSTP